MEHPRVNPVDLRSFCCGYLLILTHLLLLFFVILLHIISSLFEEMTEVEKERERWSSKTAFYFTAVGAAVGKARHYKA
jgi:hypothetical protein